MEVGKGAQRVNKIPGSRAEMEGVRGKKTALALKAMLGT